MQTTSLGSWHQLQHRGYLLSLHTGTRMCLCQPLVLELSQWITSVEHSACAIVIMCPEPLQCTTLMDIPGEKKVHVQHRFLKYSLLSRWAVHTELLGVTSSI